VAIARNDSSPLFADSALGTLKLVVYLSCRRMLMVADHRGRLPGARPRHAERCDP
jgi:rod shape-determining protein MreC